MKSNAIGAYAMSKIIQLIHSAATAVLAEYLLKVVFTNFFKQSI